MINICTTAFKTTRTKSKEIYQTHGLVHLDNVSKFYVHENNANGGKTAISQSIAESIILLAENIRRIEMECTKSADLRCLETGTLANVVLIVPPEWREDGILDSRIGKYVATVQNNIIEIGVYDSIDRPLKGNADSVKMLYKMLGIVAVVLWLDMINDEAVKNEVLEYSRNPSIKALVKIHEDFYQRHKAEDYELIYDCTSHAPEQLYSYKADIAKKKQKKKEEEIKERNKKMDKYRDRIMVFGDKAFKEEYMDLIPKLGSEFVLSDRIALMGNAVVLGDLKTILFHGPAGTGKTISCKLLSQFINLPVLATVNCTENLDEFILGKYVPIDGKIVFQESYVTKAIRDGGAVIFEEINFAKPQYLAFLNSLFDDNGFVRLDNGEVVKRNPNFRFFATMNVGYYGTKELNQALYNRFNAIVAVDELPDEAISKMLKTRVPECEDNVSNVLKFYHQVKTKINREELDIVISPRNLENWMRMSRYVDLIDAAEDTIVPIAKGDKDIETDLRLLLKKMNWN